MADNQAVDCSCVVLLCKILVETQRTQTADNKTVHCSCVVILCRILVAETWRTIRQFTVFV